MPEAILAIDAGTTSVRALVLGPDGRVLGRERRPFPINYPTPGLVEQDLEDLWQTTLAVVREALNEANLKPTDIRALGIATQRASCGIWERATGEPLSPLISWQDLRGVTRAAELQEKGYRLLPQSAACKLEAALATLQDGRARMKRGELAWGNLDAYLAWRLSNGGIHATDPSQACATGYFDFESGDWNDALLAEQGLAPDFFPALVDTCGVAGHTDQSTFGAKVPIACIVGDQQSAAIAQGCTRVGDGKVTYGTSGTCNVYTGSEIRDGNGMYPLVLMRRGSETLYCLEGMIITAGAVFDWLSEGLGILDSPADSAQLAETVADTEGVFVLPALQGLGSPHADFSRQAHIGGLTRGTTQGHIVRAAMEGIAFRTREMLDAVYADPDLPQPEALRVDGGASANEVLMQIQANALGRPVERMTPLEATAYGAALLAGRATGIWNDADFEHFRRVDRRFEPQWSEDERNGRFAAWRSACGLNE